MKNKILSISIIFILLSFIFINNNVFAVSYDLNDYKNHVGSNAYLIAYEEETETFYLFVSADSGTRYFIGGGFIEGDNTYITIGTACSATFGNWSNSQCNYYVYTFNSDSNTFANRTIYTPSNSFYFSEMLVIATNTNYYRWENTAPFFQTTPVPSQVVIPSATEVKILATETVEQVPTTMMETLKLIIPVGLVVLSVVLLIYLMRRLIYRCS